MQEHETENPVGYNFQDVIKNNYIQWKLIIIMNWFQWKHFRSYFVLFYYICIKSKLWAPQRKRDIRQTDNDILIANFHPNIALNLMLKKFTLLKWNTVAYVEAFQYLL